MKKFSSMLFACLMLLSCLGIGMPQANAAAVVTLVVTPSPDELTSAGTVDLSVAVSVGSSNSADAITDLSLYLEGGDTPIGSWARVSAGRSEVFTVSSLFIPASYLNMPFPVVLRYKDFDGAERSVSGSFTVLQGAPAGPNEARLVFLRTATMRNAIIGETVNFIYTLRNEGMVEVTDIVISDELTGTVASIPSLAPGGREEYVVAQQAIRDLVSIPKLSYTNAATGQRGEATIEPLTVPIANPKLTVALKADVTEIKSGDTVTLNCTVYNEGNVTFQDIQISDEQLGMLPGVSILEPGKSYVTTKKVVPANSVEYVFLVAAKDLDGKSTSLKSNAVSVVVEDAPATTVPSEVLRLRAVPDQSALEEPGEVTFTITVTNGGEAPIQDLTLSEISAGVLQKMDTMPTGDKVFLYNANIDTDRTFTFTVDGITADGARVQAATESIGVSLRQTAEMTPTIVATPVPTTEAELTGAQTEEEVLPPEGGGNNVLLIALVIVGALIAVCVVALIVLFTRDRSQRARYGRQAQPYVYPEGDAPFPEYPSQDRVYPDSYRRPSVYDSDEDEVTRPVAPRRRDDDDAQTRPARPKHRR